MHPPRRRRPCTASSPSSSGLSALALLLIMARKASAAAPGRRFRQDRLGEPFDRVGALFGPRIGSARRPLAALLPAQQSAPALMCPDLAARCSAFLTFQHGQRLGPHGLFVAALGTFPMATFLGTSRISVNQFGYVGGAFRRYFLLPIEPADTLRAASYAAGHYGALDAAGRPAGLDRLRCPGPSTARMLSCCCAPGSPVCSSSTGWASG